MASVNTILVVDDEPNLRQSLAAILHRDGYLVTTAADAQEVRQYLQKGPFDLVFLDLKMPGGNGITLLSEIRKQYAEMPVIILTAHATLDSAMEAVRMGAQDYLLKPIDPPRILARTREILAQQQQPLRRREIVTQIRDLLGELHQIDGIEGPLSPPQKADPAGETTRYLHAGALTLDMHTCHIQVNERDVTLPPTAFNYLATLARHSPNAVDFETLVIESQGYVLSRAEAREIIRGQIHELRKAIEPDPSNPRYLITVRDIGYRLVN